MTAQNKKVTTKIKDSDDDWRHYIKRHELFYEGSFIGYVEKSAEDHPYSWDVPDELWQCHSLLIYEEALSDYGLKNVGQSVWGEKLNNVKNYAELLCDAAKNNAQKVLERLEPEKHRDRVFYPV